MHSMISDRDIETFARSVLSPHELPFQAAKLIARRVAFDDFHFLGVDPDTCLPSWHGCGGMGFGSLLPRWAELNLRWAEHNLRELGGVTDTRSARATVVQSGHPEDEFDASARYLEILRSFDLEHEVRIIFRDHGVPWGMLVLLRRAGQPDFDPEELDLLKQLAAPIARAMRRTNLWSPAENGPVDDRPAVLVLSADLRVVSCTEAAEKLLPELRGCGCVDPEGLPCGVRGVALWVSRQPAGTGPVSSRARTHRGRWVTIRGAALEAERRIVIVFDRTARTDVVPLILAAHGLTARERNVAEHVLLGLSSQDVSEALGISEYTVQDHLKAVFDKTGVSSRKELAARLFACGAAA
jgi:DNA-binding CsgD family transcriptional regulator